MNSPQLVPIHPGIVVLYSRQHRAADRRREEEGHLFPLLPLPFKRMLVIFSKGAGRAQTNRMSVYESFYYPAMHTNLAFFLAIMRDLQKWTRGKGSVHTL